MTEAEKAVKVENDRGILIVNMNSNYMTDIGWQIIWLIKFRFTYILHNSRNNAFFIKNIYGCIGGAEGAKWSSNFFVTTWNRISFQLWYNYFSYSRQYINHSNESVYPLTINNAWKPVPSFTADDRRLLGPAENLLLHTCPISLSRTHIFDFTHCLCSTTMIFS